MAMSEEERLARDVGAAMESLKQEIEGKYFAESVDVGELLEWIANDLLAVVYSVETLAAGVRSLAVAQEQADG